VYQIRRRGVTNQERKAIDIVIGGVNLLRTAIAHCDPHRELDFRARDILADLEGIVAGHANVVASFGRMPKPVSATSLKGERE
jgi:hypothetical protein